MKEKIFLAIFFIIVVNLAYSQENNTKKDDSLLGIGVGMSRNGSGINGYNLEVFYSKFINNYLLLEGNIRYYDIDNFPKKMETGNFANSINYSGEYISNQLISANLNLHISFINNNKNLLSFYVGPSYNSIKSVFFYGINFNTPSNDNKSLDGNFFIKKEKELNIGINYGIFYTHSIPYNMSIGFKVNGFSAKSKSRLDSNLILYSINMMIIKKI